MNLRRYIVAGVLIVLAGMNVDESVAASYTAQDPNAANYYVSAGGSYTGTMDVSSHYNTNGWKMTSGTLAVKITDDGADATNTITPSYAVTKRVMSNGTTVYDYDSFGFFGFGAIASYETYYNVDFDLSRTITSTTEGEGVTLSVGGISDSGETGLVTTTFQTSRAMSAVSTYTYQASAIDWLLNINSYVYKTNTYHFEDTNILNDYAGDIFLQVVFTQELLDSINSNNGIFEYYVDSIATAIGLGDFVIDTVDLYYSGEVDVSAVPLPAAVWLFGAALAGLGAVGRRNKRQQPTLAS